MVLVDTPSSVGFSTTLALDIHTAFLSIFQTYIEHLDSSLLSTTVTKIEANYRQYTSINKTSIGVLGNTLQIETERELNINHK